MMVMISSAFRQAWGSANIKNGSFARTDIHSLYYPLTSQANKLRSLTKLYV